MAGQEMFLRLAGVLLGKTSFDSLYGLINRQLRIVPQFQTRRFGQFSPRILRRNRAEEIKLLFF